MHPQHPAWPGRWARRPQRGWEDDHAASCRRAAAADIGEDRGPRLPARADPAQLARVGFVAQDAPTYAALSVADHLRLRAHLNPGWDVQLAVTRINALGLDPGQQAGKLSGGQRAQLALTVAIAKRPELLILDEPVAGLDPLARREFLEDLKESVAEHGLSVVLSSHQIADLERVCNYLIVLTEARLQVAGDVDSLLASHQMITGARCDPATRPPGWQVIISSHTGQQATMIVRTSAPVRDPHGRSASSAWKTWCWPT